MGNVFRTGAVDTDLLALDRFARTAISALSKKQMFEDGEERRLKNLQDEIWRKVLEIRLLVLHERLNSGVASTEELNAISADLATTWRSTPAECAGCKLTSQQMSQNMLLDGFAKHLNAKSTIVDQEIRPMTIYSSFNNQKLLQMKKQSIIEVSVLFARLVDFYEWGKVPVNSVSRRRRSSMPIPQVLLGKVIGRHELAQIALEFQQSYEGQMVAWNQDETAPRIHLGDVRHYLQSNLESAYRMLERPEKPGIACQHD